MITSWLNLVAFIIFIPSQGFMLGYGLFGLVRGRMKLSTRKFGPYKTYRAGAARIWGTLILVVWGFWLVVIHLIVVDNFPNLLVWYWVLSLLGATGGWLHQQKMNSK